jgi:thiosulfate/3-mercaptopyruvate sulfurtransferase
VPASGSRSAHIKHNGGNDARDPAAESQNKDQQDGAATAVEDSQGREEDADQCAEQAHYSCFREAKLTDNVFIFAPYQYLNMKTLKTPVILIVLLFLSLASVRVMSQGGEPWSDKELMQPAALASMINNPKSQKPVIFNVGPLDDIKGAIRIGSTRDNANLEKMKKALAGVSKDNIVVIYCGCCPFRNCPNIRPAFALLKEQGFKNPRLLNLSQNLKVDWTDYGYPMK